MDQAENLRNIIKMNSQPHKSLARVITVTSGKGGVGKSNTAINLAIWFRQMGQRVIILDADFGLANIEVMFGAVPKHNLGDLIYQGKNIKEIITWGPGEVGFISGGSGIAGLSNLSRDYLMCVVQNLAELDSIADIVIVDTGAGIADAVLEFLVASGEILLVTTPEPTSITDSYSLLKSLNRHPRFSGEMSQIKVIANKVEGEAEGKALFTKLNAVVERYLKLPVSYLGAIPQDNNLSKAVMQQMPVSLANPGTRSAKAYQRIAETLIYGEVEETGEKRNIRGMAGFFSHIIGTSKNPFHQ